VSVLAVMGGVEECQRVVPRMASQRRELRTYNAELLDVAPAELLETVRLVRRPPGQPRTRASSFSQL